MHMTRRHLVVLLAATVLPMTAAPLRAECISMGAQFCDGTTHLRGRVPLTNHAFTRVNREDETQGTPLV
jgi:hypothetical protein